MTPQEFRKIRVKLGLSTREMGLALGLRGDPARAIRRYESGEVDITGPAATATLALEYGFKPPWWPRKSDK